MPNQSLSDIDAAEAATALAHRAGIVAMLKTVGLFKSGGVADFMSGIGNSAPVQSLVSAWKDPGAAGSALRGGAIGAGAGGLAGFRLGMHKKDDDDDAPSPWSSALTGALAGGGIGAGIGAAIPAAKSIAAMPDDLAAREQAEKDLAAVQPTAADKTMSAVGHGLKNFATSSPGIGWAGYESKRLLNTLSGRPGNAARNYDPKMFRRAVAGGVSEGKLNPAVGAAVDAIKGDDHATAIMQAVREGKIDPELLKRVSGGNPAIQSPLQAAAASQSLGNASHGSVENILGIDPADPSASLRPELRNAFSEFLRAGKLSDSTVASTWPTAGGGLSGHDFNTWLSNPGHTSWNTGGLPPAQLGAEHGMLQKLQAARETGSLTADKLNDLLKSTMKAEAGTVEPRGTGWAGLNPFAKQTGINTEKPMISGRGRLAIPAAIFGAQVLASHLMNGGNSQPALSPDVMARLAQYAKVHPEWVQQAREQGQQIPQSLQQ